MADFQACLSLLLPFLLLLFLSISPSTGEDVRDTCSQLESYLPQHINGTVFQDPVVIYVDAAVGNNTPECLNYNSTTAPPCATLQYTRGVVSQSNVKVMVAPGVYNLTGSFSIIDAERVSIVGAGTSSTMFTCGAFGDADSPCSYMNFQISNSSYVSVSGVTFMHCGPITSNVYISDANFVSFKDCVFRDNISPPMLLYNVGAVVLERVQFLGNKPHNLPLNVSRDVCYFSGGGDVFFLDNRTTSGGISFYNKDRPVDFLVLDCIFFNNTARPDSDLSLPRASIGYGHGGALTLRFLNSSRGRVCVKESQFEANSAQAHAGAISIATGISEMNRVMISNCNFVDNTCEVDKCTGGAVGVDFYKETVDNQFFILECNFTGNAAQSGGAISLLTYVSSDGNSDSLTLEKCLFEDNKAFFEGTAISLFSLVHADQIGFPVLINNCSFIDNLATRGSADTTAITMYQVLGTFQGNNYFVANDGGGISLLGSQMDVNGTILFFNNSAVFGGCIAMSGQSLVLLYAGARVQFHNNVVAEEGAGMYVEYTANDFVLNVLNRGCFVQYFSTDIDTPPNKWKASMEFIDNTAKDAGAAIYSNDMSRCQWLGEDGALFTDDFLIFQTPPNYTPSPFNISNNRLLLNNSGGVNPNADLGTDAAQFSAKLEFDAATSSVSYGERVSFSLSSTDQLDNFRESVWSVQAPLEEQPLGSLSSNGSVFVYDVPSKSQLLAIGIAANNGTKKITTEFSLLGTQVPPSSIEMTVSTCHPGYVFDQVSQKCDCDNDLQEIVRCDSLGRYFYVRDGLWVGERGNSSAYFATAIPGFLNCTREGNLPGCLYKFDDTDLQCAAGRKGELCGTCREGYGVTFDLRSCENCGAGGIVLFIIICMAVFFFSLMALYFDFPLPNELKGVIFFAQVIGVIYRNTPFLLRNSGPWYRFLDFVINMLGFAIPFPVCLSEKTQAFAIAFLAFVPPLIVTVTAILYTLCANRVRFLSNRKDYGFHGFYFLSLFAYKYLVDTSFIFVSCVSLDSDTVFIYQGFLKCFGYPFIIPLILCILLLIGLGVILPAYVLYIIYRPNKAIQASDALTHGLKHRRRYRWYGVWDIWRRLLFVAANLFISLASSSGVLFLHCILIIICLAIVCLFKPYIKPHINALEAFILLCLLGATISILDDNDIYVGDITSLCFIVGPLLYGAAFILFRAARNLWYMADRKWSVNAKIVEKTKPYFERLKQCLPMAMIKEMNEGEAKEPSTGTQSGTELSPDKNNIVPTVNSLETGIELREPLLEEM